MSTNTVLPESQMGPAERLLEVVLGGSAHLWHNRPGVNANGVWKPAKKAESNAELSIPPAPVNGMLEAIFASEAGLIKKMRLPFGVSIILLAQKA